MKEWQSRDHIIGNLGCYEIPDLQPGHANPGSSESDLVSGKMKETVIIYYNSSTTTVIYKFNY